MSSAATVYTPGAEIAPTTFIQSRYVNVKIGNYHRVTAGFIDGSVQLLDRLGITTEKFCGPQSDQLGESGCREALQTLAPVYLDAGCTMPAYLATASVTAASFFVSAPKLCGNDVSRFARGADVTQTTHWVKTVGGCTTGTTGAGPMYLGTLEADPFPRGTLAPGPRRGRIGHLFWTSLDEQAVELSAFDHDLGLPCRYFPAKDGRLRCLPAQPTAVTAFDDVRRLAIAARRRLQRGYSREWSALLVMSRCGLARSWVHRRRKRDVGGGRGHLPPARDSSARHPRDEPADRRAPPAMFAELIETIE